MSVPAVIEVVVVSPPDGADSWSISTHTLTTTQGLWARPPLIFKTDRCHFHRQPQPLTLEPSSNSLSDQYEYTRLWIPILPTIKLYWTLCNFFMRQIFILYIEVYRYIWALPASPSGHMCWNSICGVDFLAEQYHIEIPVKLTACFPEILHSCICVSLQPFKLS